MIPEAYERALSEGGKMKLKATALLAFGDDESRFEAAVLLHDAVRAETRAMAALPMPDAVTRLRFQVERCGCYIDGLDPFAAGLAWGEMLVTTEEVPAAVARALRSRVDARYEQLMGACEVMLRKNPLLLEVGSLIPDAPQLAARARRETAALLKAFPGVADFWFARHRHEDRAGRPMEAWASLNRAIALQPDDAAFEAARLWLAPRALPATEAEAMLRATYARISRTSPEVCLVVALGEIALLRPGLSPAVRREHVARARHAANEGQSRPTTRERVRLYLRAIQLFADELDAGRAPTDAILYRAGLGDLVAVAPVAARRDPIELLTRTATHDLDRPRAAA